MRRRSEVERLTNLGLAALLTAAVLTGLTANTAGTSWGRPFIVLHGVVGLALLVLSRWKTMIVRRALGRPRRRKGWVLSLVLAALVLITVGSGLIQTTGTTFWLGPFTTMQVHIGAAVLAVPLAILHYRRRPLRPRVADLSRRTFLRTAAVSAVAGVAWVGWERTLQGVGWPGATRRFTGSVERGSGDPDAMPVTQWLDDRVPSLDAASWRLVAGGVEHTLDDLRQMPQDTVPAILDCTSQWYSAQSWRGIRLDRLIDPRRARSIEVRSTTGYALRLPAHDLARLWLALDVGGQPLSAGHGFPARLVAPGRRGFWWVKWVASIEPSSVPWWVQSPFPLT